jgi:hypothetical protein
LIILNTNVLSELAKPDPARPVAAWADAQPLDMLHTTAINEAEILFGIAALPEGRRRAGLERAMCAVFSAVLAGRVLPFDRSAAEFYATLAIERKQSGRPAGMADLQIAAIARARGATAIVTRNTDDFAVCGVALINPWQSG